jgi:biopolymer transport protein TolR
MNIIKNKNTYSNFNSRKPMSEINVTPFVDVMLVLLIIFMITAPLLTTGVSVDLPKADNQTLPGQDEPITVTINKEGKIFLGENIIEINTLTAKLKAIASINTDSRIFIKADEKILYGNIMKVMAIITNAGYKKVALITKQVSDN